MNELTGRDTDSNSTDDYTLSYDEAGSLIDDGENYKFTYDAFYRLRKVLDRTDDSVVSEYKYNGLGFQISRHEDTDVDGDVDSSDKWFHIAFDEAWRVVATFREDDSDPKEEFVPHMAGRGGLGGSSYINSIVVRDKDANTAWLTASDGTLEERFYYCQNAYGDVAVIVEDNSTIIEWGRYSSYGIPNGLPVADTDSDGDCDETDLDKIQEWADQIPSYYDVRGDVDLDGDVDSADKAKAPSGGATLGWTNLSLRGRRSGLAGYVLMEPLSGSVSLARNGVLLGDAGRWNRRGPVGYVDLYVYVGSLTAGSAMSAGSSAGPRSIWEEIFCALFPWHPDCEDQGPPPPPDQDPPEEEQPPPGNVEKCCADWREENENDDDIRGETICCGWKKVTCIKNPQDLPPDNPNDPRDPPPTEGAGADAARVIMGKCAQAHEDAHQSNPQTTCIGQENGKPAIGPKDERIPTTVGIACASNAKCTQAPSGEQRKICNRIRRDFIAEQCASLAVASGSSALCEENARLLKRVRRKSRKQ